MDCFEQGLNLHEIDNGYASFTDESQTAGGTLNSYISAVNTNDPTALQNAINDLTEYEKTLAGYMRAFLDSGIDRLSQVLKDEGLDAMSDDDLINALQSIKQSGDGSTSIDNTRRIVGTLLTGFIGGASNGLFDKKPNLNTPTEDNRRIGWAQDYLAQAAAGKGNNKKNAGNNANNWWKLMASAVGNQPRPIDYWLPKALSAHAAIITFTNKLNNLQQKADQAAALLQQQQQAATTTQVLQQQQQTAQATQQQVAQQDQYTQDQAAAQVQTIQAQSAAAHTTTMDNVKKYGIYGALGILAIVVIVKLTKKKA